MSTAGSLPCYPAKSSPVRTTGALITVPLQYPYEGPSKPELVMGRAPAGMPADRSQVCRAWSRLNPQGTTCTRTLLLSVQVALNE